MSNIYWNVVKDEEGIFSDEWILILSSGKDYLNDGYNQREINDFPVKLKEEMECIFTWDDSVSKEELIGELMTRKGFVKSDKLVFFEEDDEVEVKESVQESKTGSEEVEDVLEDDDFEYDEDEDDMEEEEEEEEEEIEDEEISSTPTSAPTTTPTVTTTTSTTKTVIKDWNDLNTIEKMYSFLKNYTNICGIDAIIGKGIKNGELVTVLVDNGILGASYITEIEKFFHLNVSMQSKAHGSIDNAAEMTLIANGCTEDAATNLSTIYAADTNKWNNLYLYWLSILGVKDVSYAKTMMKNAMDFMAKKKKVVAELFEFEDIEIPTNIISFKVGTSSISKTTTTSVIGTFAWSLVSIVTGKIGTIETKETFIGINKDGLNDFSEEIPFDIIDVLKIRGVDISTSPLFRLPATVSSIEDVRKLLSGIEGLVEG